jgi:hypothetical protein
VLADAGRNGPVPAWVRVTLGVAFTLFDEVPGRW